MPESRATLEAELVDPEGNPRSNVARVLGWSYQVARQGHLWRALLDEEIVASADGDNRARWLLVRAHAQSVNVGYSCPSPLEGRKWLEQALATATSTELQLTALTEMVRGHGVLGQHDVGLKLLDSMAGQFSGTQGAARLEALRTEIREAKVAFQHRLHDTKVPILESLIENVRERRAAALLRGDDAMVQELQTQLAALETDREQLAHQAVSVE